MKKNLLFAICLLVMTALQAQIIHVPADYPTIQQGINAASPGDTILVAEGTYDEQINFKGKKPLMVSSLFLMDGNMSHIDNTIIDKSTFTNLDSASLVYFVSGEDTTSVLCGFTIRHGRGTVYAAQSNTYRGGGGVFISSSGAKIIHNHITENNLNNTLHVATNFADGAGIGCEWNAYNSWVVVSDNIIDHNSCTSNSVGATGAGISMFYNSRIIRNTISDNTLNGNADSYSYGSGLYCEPPASLFTFFAIVENNIINNNLSKAQINQAHSSGVCLASVTGIFSHNIVENNEVSTGTSSEGGAAVLLWAPKEGSVVRNNIFRQNISNDIGTLSIEAPSGNPNQAMVLVENNYFFNNKARRGGAAELNGAPVVLQNNVFSGNHATAFGGAVYGAYGLTGNTEHLITFINCSFFGNKANNRGGAYYVDYHSVHTLIINSVFWGDTAVQGDEIYIDVSEDSLEIANSIFIPAQVVGGHFLDGGGNINSDPLFIDLDSLNVPSWSPVIEAGIASFTCVCGETHSCPQYDILGAPRPWGSSYIDMGAYEYTDYTGIDNFGFRIEDFGLKIYPNPFKSSTTLLYNLEEASQVQLQVFDGCGRLVAEPVSSFQKEGEQRVDWDARNLPAGIYNCRLQVCAQTYTNKIIIIQ
ncbi:MAG: T9SS type A sorting domain-containing protein [Bacteroidales bacterium]|nr:T9SS type A sorting domain-containing protein [Bacteroidales bacterium]